MTSVFISCQKDGIKVSDENGFKIETEFTIDGVEVPTTKAENSMGWTTGDGIYHKNETAFVAAYAKDGYELVRFYAKNGETKYQGASSYNVKVMKDQTFKAEFRSAVTYCINCAITNPEGGTVSGIGCGKSNGIYTLTATPASGWSASWTTKQVTVAGSNVNTSIIFAQKNYFLKSKNDYSNYGLIINNTRYTPGSTFTISLEDVIGLENLTDSNPKWYVNNQFIGVGSFVSFYPKDYLYSVDENKKEFIIHFE